MTTQPKQEEFEARFELDVIAHAAGKCSFPLLALCSAEEQRVKSIVRSEKSKSYQQGRDEMREEVVKQMRDDIVKIITNSKATFFVSEPNVEIPPEEVLYELRAEICTNIETYFLSRLRKNE